MNAYAYWFTCVLDDAGLTRCGMGNWRSVRMCTYMFMYSIVVGVHVLHVGACVREHTCIHAYMYVYIHIYMYIYVYVHIHVYVCICRIFLHIFVHMHACIHMYVHIFTFLFLRHTQAHVDNIPHNFSHLRPPSPSGMQKHAHTHLYLMGERYGLCVPAHCWACESCSRTLRMWKYARIDCACESMHR